MPKGLDFSHIRDPYEAEQQYADALRIVTDREALNEIAARLSLDPNWEDLESTVEAIYNIIIATGRKVDLGDDMVVY